MKSKTTIIAIVAALLVVGAGAFYFLTKKDSGTNTATTNSTNNAASSSQETQQEETPAVTLSGALSTIGATGSEGPINGNTYTLNGVAYKFEEPSNWQTSLNQRKQACEQGYISTSYQVVTDGSTWFATTDNNSDYSALVTALKGTGINAEIASYCQ
ncbi:MAG: hypothetical protein ACREGJ_04905 [Candidatus Saccharimonadales bacterium]